MNLIQSDPDTTKNQNTNTELVQFVMTAGRAERQEKVLARIMEVSKNGCIRQHTTELGMNVERKPNKTLG
jgi:hypothetical protein